MFRNQLSKPTVSPVFNLIPIEVFHVFIKNTSLCNPIHLFLKKRLLVLLIELHSFDNFILL